MKIQHMYFEHLFSYVFMLLFIPYNKLVSGANSVVVGDGTTMSWCMENEREALLKFKQGLVDDYGVLYSWGREEDKRDCCKWRGVECSNRTGHVIALHLQNQLTYESDQPLGGTIGPSLLELKHLTYLDLSSNNFQGSRIPNFIGSLSRLRYLNLLYSNFSGKIPHQLGNLTELRSLSLGDSVTVDNLEWLSSLRSLRDLYLLSVDLEKIDWVQSISKLPFLSELHLQHCSLSRIISPSLHSTNFSSIPLRIIDLSDNNFISSSDYNWVFNFSSSLEEIDLSYNLFGGSISDAFGNTTTSLKSLRLRYCGLEGEIPKSFKKLSHLQSLELSRNNLTGQLPEVFQTLVGSRNSLESLRLGWNKFYGSLPDFTRFSSLRNLFLSHNNLQGSFPNMLGQSSCLETLVLANNKVNGSFPDLKSFPMLRVLSLANNKLKGRVPESIGQLSNLKILSLSFNLLTLEFSSDWASLFQLDYIKLANCKLGPNFPKWLRTQNNFSSLDISIAGISDSIPSWFWDLSPRLQYLNISENQIHGMLPDLSLKFFTFPTIDLHSNRFRGPIPVLPPDVSGLLLSKNNFSGSVISLCTHANELLGYVDLSNNLLSGEVPDCWIHAKNLEILDLANNNFSGKIPTTFGFKSSLKILKLNNNNFVGKLPSSLKSCRLLEFIDMSENKLSGKVPAWIGTHLTSLVVLNFRINQLRGSIPPDMCHLNRTQVLDLSHNKISGNIPNCFDKLSSFVNTSSSRATISFAYSGGPVIYSTGQIYFPTLRGEYVAGAFVQWKGKMSEYRSTLGLLKCIDLSSNRLVGNIPQELATLEGLGSLNLSRNNLTGNIIEAIGQMHRLEVLDLSENQLSGQIPIGLARLTFLGVLDLSNNNLSGKIPSSTQLQSFDASSYAGNRKLCGLPLPKCIEEDESNLVPPSIEHGKNYTDEEDEDTFVTTGFYVSVVLGFVVAFWGFVGTLLLRRSWRFAYFKFLDKIIDRISVMTIVNIARLQRKVKD